MYICLDVEENPYNIEQRFFDAFLKFGFHIVSNERYEEMDATDKSATLFAEYDYFVNGNGSSRLTLTLKNSGGVNVWSATGYGCGLTARSDMSKATKQIMSSFKRLRYKYNEKTIAVSHKAHPYNSWNEDSVKHYLNSTKIRPLEGIYKNYTNGNACKMAILKYEDKYYGIVLESDNNVWLKGETQLVLSHVQDEVYDAELYYSITDKFDSFATFKGNRILELGVVYKGQNTTFTFVKVFPATGQESGEAMGANGQCKATGSGVLISDNIVITNYHVIEDANRVEAVVNVNGVPETYNARVLCSDKTNDLAIVCIKDEKFKGQGEVPFKIVPNTIDVGTSVFTMGFPLATFLGDEVKITDGIVSSKTGYDGDVVTYQISAPIQPGNSGGPLFDKSGNLVGITNAGIDKSVADNVGYAIKTPYVLNLMDSAPITVPMPHGKNLADKPLPELIKEFIPFVVYIKIY